MSAREGGGAGRSGTRWEPVIGLEVHAQLRTRTKLFCGCPTRFGAAPNTQVCPVCLGHPGALPVANAQAVELAVRLGLALGCEIAPRSIWARKSYFYPDLPKGYQISQFEAPVCRRGEVPLGDGRTVALLRIHLEEDAGKSKHPETAEETETGIDLNRCGVPLVEIVSEPVLRSAADASLYLASLRQIVQYLDVCDGNMEEGSLRCDANVSLRRSGATELGTRTELKNLNSIRNLERAIEHEIDRQVGELEAGRPIEQETRLWDESAGRTRTMRTKEEAHDYRYFPDPDLPPLRVGAARVEAIRARLPELPFARRDRLVRELGLSPADSAVLTQTRALADYFEAVVSEAPEAGSAANWVRGELLGRIHARGLGIEECPVPPRELAKLLRRLHDGRLSGKLAKSALDEMVETGDGVEAVVARHGWEVVSDPAQLEAWVREAMDANPAEVATYRAGRTQLLHFFVGQVMRRSRGQADPAELRAMLERLLGG